MKTEVNPQDTTRAHTFQLWMKSPMPMVTLTKTIDVTHLRRLAKRKGIFHTKLPVSFQFHHVQMDGAHAGKFLANLQNIINELAY